MLRKSGLILFLVLSINGYFMSDFVFAKNDTNIINGSPFPSEISLSRVAPDEKGTDVRNAYHIKVDFKGESFKGIEDAYTIVYFLNDRLVKKFKAQSLPFTFMQTFKGLPEGPHVIKFYIQDMNKTILSISETTVNVSH